MAVAVKDEKVGADKKEKAKSKLLKEKKVKKRKGDKKLRLKEKGQKQKKKKKESAQKNADERKDKHGPEEEEESYTKRILFYVLFFILSVVLLLCASLCLHRLCCRMKDSYCEKKKKRKKDLKEEFYDDILLRPSSSYKDELRIIRKEIADIRKELRITNQKMAERSRYPSSMRYRDRRGETSAYPITIPKDMRIIWNQSSDVIETPYAIDSCSEDSEPQCLPYLVQPCVPYVHPNNQCHPSLRKKYFYKKRSRRYRDPFFDLSPSNYTFQMKWREPKKRSGCQFYEEPKYFCISQEPLRRRVERCRHKRTEYEGDAPDYGRSCNVTSCHSLSDCEFNKYGGQHVSPFVPREHRSKRIEHLHPVRERIKTWDRATPRPHETICHEPSCCCQCVVLKSCYSL